MHNIHLSNGIEMPVLGFGTYLIKPEDCAQAVEQALACGYRLIDTAQAYFNEAETGAGLVKSGVPRSQLFITTKVWISNAGEKQAMQSIEESLRRLQTDYIDLLLIHQPFGDVYGTYRALEQALSQGKVRAVGLSNFLNGRFIDMAEHFEVKPQVLQAGESILRNTAWWEAQPEGLVLLGGTALGWKGKAPITLVLDGRVTAVADQAFSSNYLPSASNLLRVEAGDSVQWLGSRVFAGQSSLNSAFLSDSVTHLGEGIFSGCSPDLLLETYLGSSDQDNVSDDVALAVMRNTVVNMRRLLGNINDMQARSNLMWDSAMAENGILKVGRLTDFQAHQIEHQLGAYTDCNHGQGLAVIHPAYYRHILKDAPEKFTRFAKEVFGKETPEEGLKALSSFIRECGLPTKMGQLKSKVEITPQVLRQVADTCNIIQCNPRRLSRDEIYEILCECL